MGLAISITALTLDPEHTAFVRATAIASIGVTVLGATGAAGHVTGTSDHVTGTSDHVSGTAGTAAGIAAFAAATRDTADARGATTVPADTVFDPSLSATTQQRGGSRLFTSA